MFQNQVKKKDRERESQRRERKREGGSGIKWKVEKKINKQRRGWRYMGIRVWWRKKQEKKKKRKRMDERNEK